MEKQKFLGKIFIVCLVFLSGLGTMAYGDDRLIGSWVKNGFNDITDPGAQGIRIESDPNKAQAYNVYIYNNGITESPFGGTMFEVPYTDDRFWLKQNKVVSSSLETRQSYYRFRTGSSNSKWIEFTEKVVGQGNPGFWTATTWFKPSPTEIPLP